MASGTGYYLRIDDGAVKDVAGNNYAGISNNTALNFTSADVIAPTLASSTPTDNAINVAVGSNLVLTFNENIQAGTGDIILYSSAGTPVETFDVATSNRLTFSGSTLTIDPSADLGSSTGYYLQIASTAITDTSGNAYVGIGDNTTLNFTTADIAAPTLTSSNPADDAVNVAVASNFVLTFSEAIAKGTGNITLYRADGTAVETFNAATSNRLSFSGQNLTINPTANLDSNASYYLQIANGAVRDLAGNNYGGINDATTFNFTTADIAAPTLTSSNPTDNAVNVAVADNLILTFSENIQAGTGDIILLRADGTEVERFAATSNQLTFSGQTLTINPSNDLASGTGYYLQFANGAVKDLAGNNFAGINNNTTLNFTTADIAAPILTSSVPTDNAINVDAASNLVLNFSENIQAGSGDIVLYNSAGTPVETFDVTTSTRLTFSGQTLTINPSSDLASGTGYYLQIAPTGIRQFPKNKLPIKLVE